MFTFVNQYTVNTMIDFSHSTPQIQSVTNFQDLVTTQFSGEFNALCWNRELEGDFSEIVNQIELNENMVTLNIDELCALQLSAQGNIARETLLNDYTLLKTHGATPTLNLIKNYERDDIFPFFPTDVYSYHVDRSPIPTSTFLCTYHGEPSEVIPNSQVKQKITIPALRNELKKLYDGPEVGFDSFLSEHFFDLHYQAQPNARPVNLGLGNLWRLTVDYPESKALPCVHRAPKEKDGLTRLLMIC